MKPPHHLKLVTINGNSAAIGFFIEGRFGPLSPISNSSPRLPVMVTGPCPETRASGGKPTHNDRNPNGLNPFKGLLSGQSGNGPEANFANSVENDPTETSSS